MTTPRNELPYIVLDMGSSVSPTHGDQEAAAWNGYFDCTCYHPNFLFNQFGILERCTLCRCDFHSADRWRDVLDPVKVIIQVAAGSRQMSNHYQTMIANEFEFGFAVDWMHKDLSICFDTTYDIGASLPVTALADQFYKDVQKMGGGRWDTSSLIKRLCHTG